MYDVLTIPGSILQTNPAVYITSKGKYSGVLPQSCSSYPTTTPGAGNNAVQRFSSHIPALEPALEQEPFLLFIYVWSEHVHACSQARTHKYGRWRSTLNEHLPEQCVLVCEAGSLLEPGAH